MAAFIMSIGLGLSAIFLPKLKSSGESRRSAAALYAAETAIEWCLYVVNKDPTAEPPVIGNGTDFVPTFSPTTAADCSANPLEVTGTFQGVTRAFEVNY